MTKKTDLYLIRHGETEWNLQQRFQGHKDSPLNETGRAQARALATRLQSTSFEAIYSSDLGRAWETADILAAAHPRAIIPDMRLRERGFGVFEGLTLAEAEAKYPEDAQAFRDNGYNHVVPGGESNTAIIQRATACLADLATRHAGERIMVVTHGGIINRFTKFVLGISAENRRMFRIHNTSINRFIYRADNWEMYTFGDIGHLEYIHDGAEE